MNNLDNDVVTPKTPEHLIEEIEENLNQSMENVSLEVLEQPNEQIYQADHNFKSMDKLNESACAEINSLKFVIPIELSRKKQTKLAEAILTHDDELYDLFNKLNSFSTSLRNSISASKKFRDLKSWPKLEKEQLKKLEKEQLVKACINRSYLWEHVKICKLTINMRIQKVADQDKKLAHKFSKYLFKVGYLLKVVY